MTSLSKCVEEKHPKIESNKREESVERHDRNVLKEHCTKRERKKERERVRKRSRKRERVRGREMKCGGR